MKALLAIAGVVLGGAVALRVLATPSSAPAPSEPRAPATAPRVAVEAPAVSHRSTAVAALPAPAEAVATQRTHLHARFTAEAEDPSWSATARSALTEDLARVPAGATVRAVECRASLCRAELALAEPGAGGAFLETWLRQRTWNGPGYAALEGESTLVLYVGKLGTDLVAGE